MALSITINGTDEVAHLLNGTLRVTVTAGDRASRADFVLQSHTVALNQTCVIADGATTYFAGYTAQAVQREVAPGLYYNTITATATGTPETGAAPFILADESQSAKYDWLMSAIAPRCWWRLGEPSGTTATDEQGVQDGTYQNTPTLGVTGAHDNDDTAITLDGSSEYVSVGSDHVKGQTSFSIACWAKTTGTSVMIYAERLAAGGNARVWLYINNSGLPAFRIMDTAGTSDICAPVSGTTNDGAWHHYVATKSGTAMTLYVDGVSVATHTQTGTNTYTGTLAANIGRDEFEGFYFPGTIDEVAVWRSALTADQAADLYGVQRVVRFASLERTLWYDATKTPNNGTWADATYDEARHALPGWSVAYSTVNFGMAFWRGDITDVEITWLVSGDLRYRLTFGDTPLTLAAAFP